MENTKSVRDAQADAWGVLALYAALWLEEAELFPVHPILEQNGRVIEAGLVADDIRRNYLPGITFQIFPLILILRTDSESRLEDITVVTAGFERHV